VGNRFTNSLSELTFKLADVPMPTKLSDRETTATKSQPGSYGSFGVGVEDIVFLPLVAIAVIVKVVLRALLTILIDIIDWVFPILLQVMRFPLFTIRILGDGIAALLKGAMRFLPIGNIRRQAWQGFISRNWAWCRQSLSYRAFEEWLHHAFEDGMAWVFRKCRSLTPPAALLVIIGAALWLPISFGVATLMHAVLLAKAASLPSWMQLLHPVATVIAKSKLLVLPAYPAAWPQAKRHPVVQAMITFWRHLTTLYLMRKIGYRYRQTESAIAEAAVSGFAAPAIGASHLLGPPLAACNATAAAIGRGLRAIAAGTVAVLSALPLSSGIVRRYKEHREEVSRQPSAPFSDKVTDFFARWSIKFSSEYYEAKEREAKQQSPA
jgi:hypothetical protein